MMSDSIVKNVEGWRLNKLMKYQVSFKSIPGAATKGVVHHVKGCLQDTPYQT